MTPKPTLFRTLFTAGSVLLLAGSLHAQMDPGFLGKRYVGASLFRETVDDSPIDSGTGIGGQVNLPLTTGLDLNGYASYERFSDYSIRDKRIGANLVGYLELDHFKPFAEAGLAGTWQSSTILGTEYKSHDGIYVVGVGVEAPISRVTSIIVKANYNKYFDSDNGDFWTYTAGLNFWLNDKFGAHLSIAFNDGETTLYTGGIVYRF